MAESAVMDKFNKMLSSWRLLLDRTPVYSLDATWPSVGVLDLLTFQLRWKENFSPEEKELVAGSAAYLGLLAEECWELMGVEVKVVDSEKGVLISGGREGKTEVEIYIEEQLTNILKAPPREFFVVGDFSRTLSPDHNYLSLFAVGVLTGYSRYARGEWSGEFEENFKVAIDSVSTTLAGQSGARYASLFPDEPIGGIPELYRGGLIYPPVMLTEDLPGCTAAAVLSEYLQAAELKPEVILHLMSNLSASPDEVISSVGLAYVAAFLDEPPSQQILAVAESKGSYMGLLRGAMSIVRDKFKLGEDWVTKLVLDEEDQKRFQIEKSLGVLSWLRMDWDTVKTKVDDQRLQALIVSLLTFDMQQAVNYSEQIIEDDPTKIDIRIQRAFLFVLEGDYESAGASLRMILSEPDFEKDSRVFNLLGLCALSLGDVEEGVRVLKKAMDFADSGMDEYSEIIGNYGWALLQAQELEKSLEILDSAIDAAPCPLTPLLNKVFVLRELGRLEESAEAQNRALELCPLDRRVFASLVYDFQRLR